MAPSPLKAIFFLEMAVDSNYAEKFKITEITISVVFHIVIVVLFSLLHKNLILCNLHVET